MANFDEGTRNKPYPNLLNEEGEYFYEDVKGVYTEPEDIGLYGRGSCDIVIKVDTVLLRAGKNKNFNRGQIPRKRKRHLYSYLSLIVELYMVSHRKNTYLILTIKILKRL